MTTSIAKLDSGWPAVWAVARARRAQKAWAQVPMTERLTVVRRLRHRIATESLSLAAAVRRSGPVGLAESLAAEVVPLAEACRFLERRAMGLLAPRRLRRGRPVWLSGSRARIMREPLGVVLVVGAANYPLLLPGVQALQALVAGNAVVVKPGRSGAPVLSRWAELLAEAGFDPAVCTVLDEAPETARWCIEAGVDKVVLTGSAETGRSVLAQLAPSLTPATLELSGCDAVFVTADADLDLVARAVRFGLTLNGGATCISPRRIFVPRSQAAGLEGRLRQELRRVPAIELEPEAAWRLRVLVAEARRKGARLAFGQIPNGRCTRPIVLADAGPEMALLRSDVFAPVVAMVEVKSDDEALQLASQCPYALGATVFGEPGAARRLAERVEGGVVVINDMVVPTADPRLPFGGRGDSGYGVTRGAEGLLEMTRTKVVVERRGAWRPHFEPLVPGDEKVFGAFIRGLHGSSWRQRAGAWIETLKGLAARGRRSPRNR